MFSSVLVGVRHGLGEGLDELMNIKSGVGWPCLEPGVSVTGPVQWDLVGKVRKTFKLCCHFRPSPRRGW